MDENGKAVVRVVAAQQAPPDAPDDPIDPPSREVEPREMSDDPVRQSRRPARIHSGGRRARRRFDDDVDDDAALDLANTRRVPHTYGLTNTEDFELEHELPLDALRDAGFVTPDMERTRQTEQLRKLKRALLRHGDGSTRRARRENVIMVTSSVTGEGKTYTAANLALSLSLERGHSVLLVDADVIKGSLTSLFGIERDRPGFVDLLEGTSADIRRVGLRTNVPDLAFLPVGSLLNDATELIASEATAQFIEQLAEDDLDRTVVFDCPPMMQTNEAAELASHAGQVVFVVGADRVGQRLVDQALSLFDTDTYVGLVLNGGRQDSSDGYDYDYG